MSASSPVTKGARSLLLLASLILLLLAAPLSDTVGYGATLMNILFALVLLATTNSVSELKWHRALASVLAALWLVLQLWSGTAQSQPLMLAARIVLICFCCHSAAVLLRREVNARRVDFEVLCSLPSIYLLISIIWAVSYQIIETASPGSFQGGGGGDGAVPGFSEFLYFSLVTSTTLGYGDIAPVGPVTRMWVALEAVAGVFFMAVLVSRLVTLYRG